MKVALLTTLALAVGLALSADAGFAQTTTAFKTGEKTTGMTKQCYYDALGSEHTRTVTSVALCPLSIQVRLAPSTPTPAPTPQPRTITAFKTGEKTTGMTKQCYYDGLGSEYTRTVSSVELCPLSIRVSRG
jgi:hypothetical protein